LRGACWTGSRKQQAEVFWGVDIGKVGQLLGLPFQQPIGMIALPVFAAVGCGLVENLCDRLAGEDHWISRPCAVVWLHAVLLSSDPVMDLQERPQMGRLKQGLITEQDQDAFGSIGDRFKAEPKRTGLPSIRIGVEAGRNGV